MTGREYFLATGKHKGQSVIEYALLAAITVIALLAGANFVGKFKKNALDDHFETAAYYTGGVNP